MKKLLFLIVSMVVVGGVNAQTRTIKSVPNEAVQAPVPQQIEKENAVCKDIPSYLNHYTILENMPMFSTKKKQKANYVPFDIIASTEYAVSVLGQDGALWTGQNANRATFMLFPDSLGVFYINHVDNSSNSFNQITIPSLGFNFDPYSKAFDSQLQTRLLEDQDGGVYGYKIDTLYVLGEYFVADYDENKQDFLRIHISYYNAYRYPDGKTPDPKNGMEYFLLGWDKGDYGGKRISTSVVEYDDINNIAQKGAVTKPVAANRTINYPLTLEDSVDINGNYLRYIKIPVDFEVPVGYIASVVVQFVPGYDYDNEDILYQIDYNGSTQTVVNKDVRKNVFFMGAISDSEFGNFLDVSGGLNSRLMEDKNIRYNGTNYNRDSSEWNPNKYQVYSFLYYAIPYALMYISIDEDDWWDLNVTEPNAVVSRMYPNPANDQVQIELINDGTAELSIMNTLGQVVKVAAMNEISNTIDVSSLSPGIYMLKITQGGNVYTTKLTKK